MRPRHFTEEYVADLAPDAHATTRFNEASAFHRGIQMTRVIYMTNIGTLQ